MPRPRGCRHGSSVRRDAEPGPSFSRSVSGGSMQMRQGTLVLAFALGTGAIAGLPAQGVDSHCTDPAIVGVTLHGGDACQKVADLFNYMNMQIGTWVAGGNPTLGQGGTLGGLGHVSVGVRANVMEATLPAVDEIQVQS